MFAKTLIRPSSCLKEAAPYATPKGEIRRLVPAPASDTIAPAAPSRALVSLTNLHRTYRMGHTSVQAVRGVSLEVARGELLALCGPSGSGKTTLLNMIGLIDRPDQGREPDCYVLELSSFQLETTSSLAFDAASVLNVTEDHLDRYDGMADYAAAKARVFNHCRHQVLNRDDHFSVAMRNSSGCVSYFGQSAPLGADHFGLLSTQSEYWLAHDQTPLLAVADLPLAGGHNAANALAALALARAIDLPYAPLLEALKRFRGLPHRVEKVMDIGAVGFYDDSKGTNVGATVAALNGMKEKVVLIAGGEGKGQDFSPLNDAVAKHARAVVLIGRDAELIASAIAASGVAMLRAKSMDEAVKLSLQVSEPGDRVLLSPACASFDMFNNYAHRGQVFVDAVRSLAAAQRSVSNGTA